MLWLGSAFAEEPGIFGVVQDAHAHALAGAEVQGQSEATGARWKTRTNDEGYYSFTGLPPGTYKVTVRMPGFRTVARVGAILDAVRGLPLDFSMELLSLHETITVVSGRDDVDPSGGDSLLMTRTSPGATLPINGNDFRASFDLLPGIVVTPAQASDAGQFTSNGQRPNTSAYRVDGVSANTGVGGSGLPGSFPGASLPAMNLIGTTENLASPETTQSMELRTSAFAPEYGERPGAEVLVTTRSGSNEFHGEFFAQLRDSGWTARDWFANSFTLGAFPRSSYYRLGGVLGGPLVPNRTYFFASEESAHLKATGVNLALVPSLAARAAAPVVLRNVLAAFPQPLGPDLADGTAVGDVGADRSVTASTFSLRLDQSLGSHGTLFLRGVDSPSNTSGDFLYAFGNGRLHWDSITVGLTAGFPANLIHEAHLNYSRARLSTHLSDYWSPLFSLGGLYEMQAAAAPPVWPGAGSTLLGLSVPGFGEFIGGSIGSPRQDQWEFRYALGWTRGRHQARAGVDGIRLTASRDSDSATLLGTVPSLNSLLAGGPVQLALSVVPRASAAVDSTSIFVQDSLHVSDRLNLLYGLRWELTPPTATAPLIAALAGVWSGGSWQPSPSGNYFGAAAWPMRYGQVAPRLGLAYRLPRSSLVLRAGAGLFYDATLGASVNPINGAPFNSWLLPGGGTGSIGGSSGSGGPSSGDSGASDVAWFLTGHYPDLRLPASYQWRASIDKALGRRGTASIGYLGSRGIHLLGNEAYVDPATEVLTERVLLSRNSSNYQALQIHYTGNVASSLFASTSYTWSHSIDNGSQDSGMFLIHPGYRLDETRASSSFDVRHALTASVSYRVPRWPHLYPALAGWTISGIARVRGGFPLNLFTSQQALGQSFENVGHPDRVPGVPVWIADASVAGGRRLNPAAFGVPPDDRRGTLGRNPITGNGLAQWDASVRREFPIYHRLALDVSVNIFNVLNHPAFSDPVPYLSSPLFGKPTSMQNLMLGSGTPNTGLPALFQSGGARSAELGFRLSF